MGRFTSRTITMSRPAFRNFLYIFLPIYVGYFIYNLLNHELWRDEIQPWGLAVSSNSVGDVLSKMEYEGRPPLWQIILFAASRVSTDPNTLKVIALIIFLLNTYLVLSLRNFSLAIRVFTLLGFYFIYGYSVTSRDYNLLLLFHLVAMKIVERNETRYRYLVPILLAFGLTNGFGFIFAIYWATVALVKSWKNREWKKSFLSLVPTMLIVGVAQLAYAPPKDSVFATQISNFSFFAVKRSLVNVFTYPFIPIQNSDIPKITLFVLAISILTLLVLSLFSFPTPYLSGFGLAVIAIFLNSVFGYYLYWWHFGIVFLLFYASAYGAAQSSYHWSNQKKFLATFLVLQIIGAIFGVGRDFEGKKVYSNINIASEFIKQNCNKCTVVTVSSVYGSPLASFVRPIKVYSVDVEDYVYFTSWKASNFRKVMESDIQESISKFSQVLIVTTQMKPLNSENFRLIASFDNAVWDDDFQIYVPIER